MKQLILIMMVIGVTGCAKDVMEGLGEGLSSNTPPVCHGVISDALRTYADECATTCTDVACMQTCLNGKADLISPQPVSH